MNSDFIITIMEFIWWYTILMLIFFAFVRFFINLRKKDV